MRNAERSAASSSKSDSKSFERITFLEFGSARSAPAAIQSNHVDIPLYSSLQMRPINTWCNRIRAVRSRWMICVHKRPANAAIVSYGCYFSGD
jgi:hypothetical protein